MIRSMTAFARTSTTALGNELVWEMRSVNHRFLEVMLRLPEACRDLEVPLRDSAKACLARGRIDATLRLTDRRPSNALHIDEDALAGLIATLDRVRALHPNLTPPGALEVLRWPGVVIDQPAEVGAIAHAVRTGFATALQTLVDNRAREGAALCGVLEERLVQISALVVALQADAANLPQLQRQRLLARIAELQSDVDPSRVAQEVTLLAQRSDIGEELDRLTAHVAEFRRALTSAEPIGRHLDFLAQELNREANTLSSKAATVAMSQYGIELKVLIEQIREQVQNVE